MTDDQGCHTSGTVVLAQCNLSCFSCSNRGLHQISEQIQKCFQLDDFLQSLTACSQISFGVNLDAKFQNKSHNNVCCPHCAEQKHWRLNDPNLNNERKFFACLQCNFVVLQNWCMCCLLLLPRPPCYVQTLRAEHF